MDWIYGFLAALCFFAGSLLLAVNCRSRYWLASFMYFLAGYLGLILLDAQPFFIAPSLYFLFLTIIFLPGPLLLGYISHISSSSHISIRDFIPATLPLFVVLTCSHQLDGTFGMLSNEQAYQTSAYTGLFNLISVMAGLCMLSYLFSSVRLLLKLKKSWATYQSQTLPRSWHKMVRVMVVTLLATVLQIVSAFGNPAGDRISIGDIAFILYVSYFIVIAIQTTIDNHTRRDESDAMLESIRPDFTSEALVGDISDEQDTEDLHEKYAHIKQQVLDKELHLQSDLTLSTLADALDTTPNKLSMYINNGLGVTFYEFINDLRCRYAARVLLESPGKPITDIVFEAGFTAKSTFYHHFKKVHGVTPSQFRTQK